MFRRIFKVLARALDLLGIGMHAVGGVLQWPFNFLGGLFGARPTPHYEDPQQPDTYLARVFDEMRKPDDQVRISEADAFKQVCDYVRRPNLRSTVDLSAVREDVRNLLQTMSKVELQTLGGASDSKIRLFAAGQDPQIFGVPHVGMVAKAAKPAPQEDDKKDDVKPLSTIEEIERRIRTRIPSGMSSRPFVSPGVRTA